jgi:hypothetical protein
MCSLRFENNFLTIEGVRFALISKKNLIIEAFVRFTLLEITGIISCCIVNVRKFVKSANSTVSDPVALDFTAST